MYRDVIKREDYARRHGDLLYRVAMAMAMAMAMVVLVVVLVVVATAVVGTGKEKEERLHAKRTSMACVAIRKPGDLENFQGPDYEMPRGFFHCEDNAVK
jgi:uncharacterized membrane protein